jgi:hypothetical protein
MPRILAHETTLTILASGQQWKADHSAGPITDTVAACYQTSGRKRLTRTE